MDLGGRTDSGIQVPDYVVATLGSGKRPAVRVTLGGYTYRTTVAPMANCFYIPLNAENRDAAGVAAGQTVDVDIELDTDARELPLLADLAAALQADEPARAFFAELSYTHRKEWRWIEVAKTQDRQPRGC